MTDILPLIHRVRSALVYGATKRDLGRFVSDVYTMEDVYLAYHAAILLLKDHVP